MGNSSYDQNTKSILKYPQNFYLVVLLISDRTVYDELVANGTIVPAQEVPPPTVPMDYSWARVRTDQFLLLSVYG